MVGLHLSADTEAGLLKYPIFQLNHRKTIKVNGYTIRGSSVTVFSSHVQPYRKSCCTILGIGRGVSKNVEVFTFKFLCDRQGADR